MHRKCRLSDCCSIVVAILYSYVFDFCSDLPHLAFSVWNISLKLFRPFSLIFFPNNITGYLQYDFLCPNGTLFDIFPNNYYLVFAVWFPLPEWNSVWYFSLITITWYLQYDFLCPNGTLFGIFPNNHYLVFAVWLPLPEWNSVWYFP